MKTEELTIEGMSCDHCIMSVRKELSKVPGVIVQNVQIGKARLQFDEKAVNMQQLAAAIEDAGYRLVSS